MSEVKPKKPNAQHHLLPKNSTLVIRLTSAQKLYLRKLARSENLTISSYVLKQLGFDFCASSSLGLKNNTRGVGGNERRLYVAARVHPAS